MKSRLLFIIALLVTALGGAKAANTYTVNIRQGCTLNPNDIFALTLLTAYDHVLSSEASGNTTTFKDQNQNTLFSYTKANNQIIWSLPTTTSSANNLTHYINPNTLILLPTNFPTLINYDCIALVFPDPVPYAEYNSSSKTLTFSYGHPGPNNTYLLNTGTNNPGWPEEDVTKVIFNSSFANARPTTCYKWFDGMSSLTTITGIANLNTSRVTYMDNMFRNCSSLTTLNLSSFNTANVTRMYGMFSGCSGLTNLNVSDFNTTNVTDMRNMFHNCFNLTTLDLSSFTITSSTNTEGMLLCYSPSSSDVSSLQTLTVSSSLINHLYRDAC